MTYFIVILTLLQWFGTEPTGSLRYSCTHNNKTEFNHKLRNIYFGNGSGALAALSRMAGPC